MNLHYLIRRPACRATCIKHSSVRLDRRARIVNIGSASGRIRIGERSTIQGELLVFPHDGNIRIGQRCFVGEGSRLWSGASITVGDRMMISHNVNIIDNQTHPTSPKLRHRHCVKLFSGVPPASIDLGDEPVRIDDDSWNATGAIILRGVRIGRGAIVSAGAVVTKSVTKSVAEYCVVAGNPAVVVRQLSEDEISREPNAPLREPGPTSKVHRW